MTGLPWQWRFEQGVYHDGRPWEEWKFYPGTVKPHLRLVNRPGHDPYICYLYDTFLSEEQRDRIGRFIFSEEPWLMGQEIIDVDWETCE